MSYGTCPHGISEKEPCPKCYLMMLEYFEKPWKRRPLSVTRFFTRNRKKKLISELNVMRKKVDTLFDAIKHGDDKHQRWLKNAIEDHFNE